MGILQVQGIIQDSSLSVLPCDFTNNSKLRYSRSAIMSQSFYIEWANRRTSLDYWYDYRIKTLRNTFEFAPIGCFADAIGVSSRTLRAYRSRTKRHNRLPTLTFGSHNIIDIQGSMPELIKCNLVKADLANKMSLKQYKKSPQLAERARYLHVRMMELVDEIEESIPSSQRRLEHLKNNSHRLPIIRNREIMERVICKKYLLDPIQIGAVAFVPEDQFGSIPDGVTKLEINGYKGFGVLELECPGIYEPIFSSPITPMCQKFFKIF